MRLGVHYASKNDPCPRASRMIRYYRKNAPGTTVHSWGREQFSTTKSETLTASDHESLVSSGCFALFCMRVNRPESKTTEERARGAARRGRKSRSNGREGGKSFTSWIERRLQSFAGINCRDRIIVSCALAETKAGGVEIAAIRPKFRGVSGAAKPRRRRWRARIVLLSPS